MYLVWRNSRPGSMSLKIKDFEKVDKMPKNGWGYQSVRWLARMFFDQGSSYYR
jgi:hypothetical protein